MKPIEWNVTEQGCWEVTSHKPTDLGYTRVKRYYAKVKHIPTHRYIYEELFGEIPKDMEVMHKCDNRKCINPEHLTLGTHADNMKDMALKGRGTSSRFTKEELTEISTSSMTALELSQKYGITRTYIYHLRKVMV